MKAIILAMFLSVVQATPPVPRQATDSPAGTGGKVQNNPATKKTPPGQTAPSANQDATPNHKDSAEKQGREDTNHSIRVSELPPVTVATPKRDWADWGTWAFNGLLVIVGFLQAILLCWTYRLIEHQAREMTRQRVAMTGQLKTMQSQLAEMKSSGEQTNRLIEQATATAIAAKTSADAAIAANRAWIMVSLDKVPTVGDFVLYGPGVAADGIVRHTAGIRVRCICINHGKTPAKIVEKRAIALCVTEDNPLPDIPDLDIEIVDPIPYTLQAYPGPGQNKDLRLYTEYQVSESQKEMTSFFVVYGVVKYQHLFSENIAHTTFGYKIGLNGLERLIEHPEYNKST